MCYFWKKINTVTNTKIGRNCDILEGVIKVQKLMQRTIQRKNKTRNAGQ